MPDYQPYQLRFEGVGDGLLHGAPSLSFDGHSLHQSTAGSPPPSCSGSACLDHSRVDRASLPAMAGPGGLLAAMLPNTDLTPHTVESSAFLRYARCFDEAIRDASANGTACYADCRAAVGAENRTCYNACAFSRVAEDLDCAPCFEYCVRSAPEEESPLCYRHCAGAMHDAGIDASMCYRDCQASGRADDCFGDCVGAGGGAFCGASSAGPHGHPGATADDASLPLWSGMTTTHAFADSDSEGAMHD